eukprot:PhM_4_TR3414/c0_g1_i3/m.82486
MSKPARFSPTRQIVLVGTESVGKTHLLSQLIDRSNVNNTNMMNDNKSHPQQIQGTFLRFTNFVSSAISLSACFHQQQQHNDQYSTSPTGIEPPTFQHQEERLDDHRTSSVFVDCSTIVPTFISGLILPQRRPSSQKTDSKKCVNTGVLPNPNDGDIFVIDVGGREEYFARWREYVAHADTCGVIFFADVSCATRIEESRKCLQENVMPFVRPSTVPIFIVFNGDGDYDDDTVFRNVVCNPKTSKSPAPLLIEVKGNILVDGACQEALLSHLAFHVK